MTSPGDPSHAGVGSRVAPRNARVEPGGARLATARDRRAVSLALARAFRNDPVHRWILPAEIDWSLASAAFFARVMDDSLRGGGAYTTEAHEGAALWFPPYPEAAPLRQQLAMALRWYLVLGRRALAVGRQLQRLERARPLEPHWYLAVLGTDPRHQLRGVGSALLAPVLARCDADRIPAYLESSKRSNVPFYERHGFALLSELAFEDGPTVWRMQREPQR